MIRAAIVGLGRWGRSLVASMQGKSKDLRFVLAHTRTRATAEDFCRAQGLALVDSYEQLLADPNVDAVVLATPHSVHESQIIAAAMAGKHIHVEKPITLDRASADRARSEEHTSELQSLRHLVCRLLLEKKKNKKNRKRKDS